MGVYCAAGGALVIKLEKYNALYKSFSILSWVIVKLEKTNAVKQKLILLLVDSYL